MPHDGAGARSKGLGPEPPWYLRATPLATLPWLIRLRWAAAAVDVLTLAGTLAFGHADFPLGHLAPFIAASGLGHAAIALSLTAGRPIAKVPLLWMLVLDVVLLTGVLELTGGPFNPFAVIYAVHVALATVSIGRPAAGVVAAGAVVCYSALLYRHVHEGIVAHHRINDFPTHIYAMWIASASLAELVLYVVGQASASVESMRERAARSERLVSLTTLAAGAAHELSTPLGTIAVVARELEIATGRDVPIGTLADDVRLIRTEVDRCRTILDQMSGRAGGSAADVPELVDVEAAIAEIVDESPAAGQVTLDAVDGVGRVRVSRAGLRQAMRSVLKNAVEASGGSQPVRVRAERHGTPAAVRIVVSDRGPGMPAHVLARAGEPFFTTKDQGCGMGLGLFLARVFAERHGGTLSIESGDGTTVVLDLPLAED